MITKGVLLTIPCAGNDMPVGSDKSTFLKSLRVAFDRKDRDVSGRAVQDLVSDCFGTGKGRLKLHLLSVLSVSIWR